MEVGQEYKLREKKKSDICMIMYNNGTTGDPKGVLIHNGSLVAVIAGLRHHMIAGNIAILEDTTFVDEARKLIQETDNYGRWLCSEDAISCLLDETLNQSNLFVSKIPCQNSYSSDHSLN